MKNFKDLTPAQKTKAVDMAIDKVKDDVAQGSAGQLFNKLKPAKQKDITDQLGDTLCGCYGCLQFIKTAFSADNELKEFIIAQAQSMADKAFYREDDDTIFKVD